MYMVFQGISPLFWGSVADMVGRRPVFISTFMVYIAACVGLASSKTFAALISLRMLQSFGSSSAIAVGAGTIGKYDQYEVAHPVLLTLLPTKVIYPHLLSEAAIWGSFQWEVCWVL